MAHAVIDQGDQDGLAVRTLEGVLNGALERQWQRASQTVASHRRRNPSATADEVAQRIARNFVMDVTVVGAAGAVMAAVPGHGDSSLVTGGKVLGAGALFERAAIMVLGVAGAYGLDLADVEVRRHSILPVLVGWAGAAGRLTGVAGNVGAGLGAKATKSIPMPAIHAVNHAVGKQVVFKWATRPNSIRLGSLLPLGIGAGLGGTSNYLYGLALGKTAIHQFRKQSPSARTAPAGGSTAQSAPWGMVDSPGASQEPSRPTKGPVP